MADRSDARPILIAYDGSDYAKEAIQQAGDQLRSPRPAIVLTVWQPYSGAGFIGAPIPPEIEEGQDKEARRLADEGAQLARKAGFQAEPLTERGDPVWERIVEVAEERDADLLVLGSHGRTGVERVLLGSVASTVASHTKRPVLIAHRR